jgi:hypothetical protein
MNGRRMRHEVRALQNDRTNLRMARHEDARSVDGLAFADVISIVGSKP